MNHRVEPGTLPYRYADGESFENTAQSTPRLPTSVPSQSPSPFSSWNPSSVTRSVLDVPTVGPNSKHPAYSSTEHDYPRSGDYCHGWEFSAPAHRYDSSVPPSQFVDGPSETLDELFPRTPGVIYTDDARIKAGNGICRQCFNCKDTETTSWRRSKLSPGKLLCNKCGLFEHTHAVPRPTTLPHRRPSRLLGTNPPLDIRYYYHRPSPIPYAPHRLDPFPSMAGETTSQDTSWMTYNMLDISPTPSSVGSSHPDAE